MNVAILGAGNVAWHLSRAFIMSGYPVRQIWNRTPDKAADLSFEIGGNSISDLSQIKDEIDLVVITVSDSAIEKVASLLKLKEHQILVHTSGSTSIDILKPYAKDVGVIYPLQTFTKGIALDFSTIPFFIEGVDSRLEDKLLRFMGTVVPKVIAANSDQRMKLHISAVFACNFTNHFYSIAEEVLKEAGLEFEHLKPLILETANKILKTYPKNAQTGPARRNDVNTMDKHLEVLSTHPDKEEIYASISQHIVKMYQKKAEDLK
ncbi:Rossmann-like and DUF2520 domain-containing protein [Pseudopedobacter beijingensis]|uniref:Rossmann-like and DUF2520 domain-containing protein n=1 Tax=Pseudopedobacter beijingensis TaxID=1207056 RepID=A0ABW4IH24_9SPHI